MNASNLTPSGSAPSNLTASSADRRDFMFRAAALAGAGVAGFGPASLAAEFASPLGADSASAAGDSASVPSGGGPDAASGATLSQAAAATPARSQYFELRFYALRQGSQGTRMNEWNSKTLMPLMKKHGFGTAGYFNVSVGPMPMMVSLVSYPSWTAIDSAWQKLGGDPEFYKSLNAMEAADPEPMFERAETQLLRAANYSPEPKVMERPKTPRIFELRRYESDNYQKFVAINRRFNDHTVALFKKHGFDQVFYGTPEYGTAIPNLTYLLAFDSLAARDACWASFNADPEWQKVRKASIDEGGQIVSRITNWLLSPTVYSPIQ